MLYPLQWYDLIFLGLKKAFLPTYFFSSTWSPVIHPKTKSVSVCTLACMLSWLGICHAIIMKNINIFYRLKQKTLSVIQYSIVLPWNRSSIKQKFLFTIAINFQNYLVSGFQVI